MGKTPPADRSASTGASYVDAGAPVRSVGVLLALILATLGTALPALALLWTIVALLTTGIAAETLEQTGGLEPTTFGGGYWIALCVNGLTLLWCVVRRMRRYDPTVVRNYRAPWRPLVWLCLIYTALIWLTVPLDWLEVWDVPDIITTFAVLGVDMLVSYVLPFALLGLLVIGVRWAFFASQDSAHAARRVMALAGCMGLLGTSIVGAMYLAGTEGYFSEFAPGDDELAELEHLGVEEERQAFVEIAASIGESAPERYSVAYGVVETSFDRCARELANPEDRPSHFRIAISRLIREGMSEADAEDTVMDALIRVCIRDAGEGIDDLPAHFARTVCNKSREHYRLSQVCFLGQHAAERCACEDDGQHVVRVRRRELALLHATLDKLTEPEREALQLYYEREMTHGELAAQLKIGESDARQRVKRALDRLRHAYEGRE